MWFFFKSKEVYLGIFWFLLKFLMHLDLLQLTFCCWFLIEYPWSEEIECIISIFWNLLRFAFGLGYHLFYYIFMSMWNKMYFPQLLGIVHYIIKLVILINHVYQISFILTDFLFTFSMSYLERYVKISKHCIFISLSF